MGREVSLKSDRLVLIVSLQIERINSASLISRPNESKLLADAVRRDDWDVSNYAISICLHSHSATLKCLQK